MAEKKFAWRVLLRAIHRDAGYVAVGLTFIYALSGLAVNHIGDWDPSFQSYETTHEIGPLSGSDDAIQTEVRRRLGIKEAPSETFASSEGELQILFDKRTLVVTTRTGHVVDQGQKPRFLLRIANWLHLNRGKKAWRYV